ncbi:MAG: cytochrome c oxidase subunit I [Deltaproteobacteria bacterium]|nr:cytochrome c oxidase subunit I [Deltaproteobacteria bacterium]
MSDNSHTDAHNEPDYLRASTGIKSWLFSVDHKRIGVMYLIATTLFMMLGGLMALGIRLELFTASGDLIDADTYNRLFTLHGSVMVFLVIIPAAPAVIGNFVLPLMLGAKDVAFPRLNLASFHIYMIGAIFLIASMILGSFDTGWTFYTPYSSTTNGPVAWALTGVFILGFSSILTGLNFIVTIHKMRAPGMTWFRMPLLLWSLYATSAVQLLATPVLAITVLLLFLERLVGIGIFDPSLGGDPILFQHFFWFYSHPAVYIMILPAFGIISELVSVHSQRKIFGYKGIALSSISIAIVGSLVWGHHMFTSGQSIYANLVFSFLTFFVAIPTAIKVFSWVATLYRGNIQITPPMMYVFTFMALFMIGGLTGVTLGALSLDVHLHDTYFVVAHFHYVMMGGGILAYIAGLHHWWPKIFGRMYPQKLARITSITVFLSFNLTFFPMFIVGSRGMPRRYYEYVESFTWLNQLATVGAFFLGTSLFVTLGYLIWGAIRGPAADNNPWGALSLEWHTSSPPIEHNFHGQPTVDAGPYDYPEESSGTDSSSQWVPA